MVEVIDLISVMGQLILKHGVGILLYGFESCGGIKLLIVMAG